jgi:hypothetical protein
MAAKETKTDVEATKQRPAPGGATSTKGAAPDVTQEMIAERAYHIFQSGQGGTAEDNWQRAEAELRQGSER